MDKSRTTLFLERGPIVRGSGNTNQFETNLFSMNGDFKKKKEKHENRLEGHTPGHFYQISHRHWYTIPSHTRSGVSRR